MGEFPGRYQFHESILDETLTFILPKEDSLYLKKKNMILFQKSRNAFKTTSAQLTTLDDFIKEYNIDYIDIFKVDVEGFEYQVLRGANIALRDKKINVVQFVRHTNDMREDNFLVINEFLRVRGYLRVKEIKHTFGDFSEMLYQRS